jgi:O-antigen ligase
MGELTVDGLNADVATLLMALGSHSLIGLMFGIEKIWMRVTFLAMSLLPMTAMVYTGTRGGMLAFVAGAAVYVLPYCGSKRKKAAILGVTIAVVFMVYTVVNNQDVLLRFEKLYNTGDSSGRDKIYAASIKMIAEKPLLGWRPIVFTYELGPRAGKMVRIHTILFSTCCWRVVYLALHLSLLASDYVCRQHGQLESIA